MLKPWLAPPPPAHDSYRSWLVSPGSLTARIVARCGEFHVERRFQGLRMPARDEARMIGLRDRRFAHVREVVLVADDVPVVFAHSVAAPRDLRGVWQSVGKLGTRPLAAAVFANPRVRRLPLEYRRIKRNHYLHARVRAAGLAPPATLWARRSLFRLHGRPLLVELKGPWSNSFPLKTIWDPTLKYPSNQSPATRQGIKGSHENNAFLARLIHSVSLCLCGEAFRHVATQPATTTSRRLQLGVLQR